MHRFLRNWLIPILGGVFVLGGALYLLLPEYQNSLVRAEGQRTNTAALATAQKNLLAAEVPLSVPVALSLPRLGISLQIKEGAYAAGRWTLDNVHAFYARANTPLIYGHAIREVFLGLHNATKNELLYITNDKSQKLAFRLTTTRVVTPSTIALLNEKKARTLFLLTCTGPYFESRQVFEFSYIGLVPSKERL